MGKKQKRRPALGMSVLDTKKNPRISDPISSRPSWRVGRLDFDGPWCPKKMVPTLDDIIQRLKGYEGLSWHEVHKSGSHSVSLDKIIPEAQRRLEELNLDDVDNIYSLRIGGQERIWGIKQGDAFLLLWWDPEHQVCPSNKKHT